MMDRLFAILILSFLFTSLLAVPFINLLYHLKFRRKRVKNPGQKGTTLSELHDEKVGTPTGGGILIVISTILFSLLFYALTGFELNWTARILFFTLTSFGIVGFYDDIKKMVRIRKRSPLRALTPITKLLLQIGLASYIGYLLYMHMGISEIYLPLIGPLFNLSAWDVGIWIIPISAFVIVSTSNAFNITDGLDGLATGLLMIALTAYWYLAGGSMYAGDIILFIAVIMGSLAAFLYFNIYPARLFMGDTGSMALGAMLAVIALITNQVLVLSIIGGVFVVEGASSLIQILSKKLRGKRVFKIAPLHFTFQANGWDETKVTMRFWLAGIILAFIGLFVATFQGL